MKAPLEQLFAEYERVLRAQRFREEDLDVGRLKREIEVLGLVAVGLASREIAERLYISAATVNNHRQRISEKTGARNSSEAVRYAARLGIL